MLPNYDYLVNYKHYAHYFFPASIIPLIKNDKKLIENLEKIIIDFFFVRVFASHLLSAKNHNMKSQAKSYI